ncbi:hypothetical protein EJ110_NYTH37241 [Nymphaea thermarum]|nr:hypothetical protein EJ110_NYTH37241 [Nymphaea thermarum]
MEHVRKKPKVEEEDVDVPNGEADNLDTGEEEEALVALIEHRNKEVENLAQKLSYFTKQVAFTGLEEAKKKLNESQSKLVRLRRKRDSGESKAIADAGTSKAKLGDGLTNLKHADEIQSHIQNGSRPQLLIPALSSKTRPPKRLSEGSMKLPVGSQGGTPVGLTRSSTVQKGETSGRTSHDLENDRLHDNAIVHKTGKKEYRDLVPVIRSSSTACTIRVQPCMQISSQHKRKLRSLALNPISGQLFATRSNVSLLSSTDCVSPKRRWPEDMTWHPHGNSIFAAYSADDGDSQVSILNLNSSKESRVSFLEEKPHHKGIINGITFMPWSSVCFVTGGSDHAVILWNEKDGGNSWKPKLLHRYIHSAAVMGVAGMPQRHMVVSSGVDKRIVGFDVEGGKADFKHQIDSKCMGVLPNPSDFNLFMVQTGTPEKQLRLFDIRVRQMEIHAFGWKQESSDSQSALIDQAWSPDGMYITSGSTDPVIHIFDIRYNSRTPTQSVKAHQKREGPSTVTASGEVGCPSQSIPVIKLPVSN